MPNSRRRVNPRNAARLVTIAIILTNARRLKSSLMRRFWPETGQAVPKLDSTVSVMECYSFIGSALAANLASAIGAPSHLVGMTPTGRIPRRCRDSGSRGRMSFGSLIKHVILNS